MGGKSSSSSSSSSSTNTTNIDRRQVIAENGIGLTSDNSTINVTSLDGGIVTSALDVVKANDATNGASFSKLLDMAATMFDTAGSILGKAQETTTTQLAALNTATNDQKGAIDQKTMIIIGAVALGFVALKGKK